MPHHDGVVSNPRSGGRSLKTHIWIWWIELEEAPPGQRNDHTDNGREHEQHHEVTAPQDRRRVRPGRGRALRRGRRCTHGGERATDAG